MNKVTLELTEKQVKVLSNICETGARLAMGKPIIKNKIMRE